MCAPEHISLVICVSQVGKHKTLKLCIQAFEWHKNGDRVCGNSSCFSSSRRANSQILLQRSRRMNCVFMLRFGCSRDFVARFSQLTFRDFVAVSWASQSTCDNHSELRRETHITQRTQAVICVSLDQEICFNNIH